MIAGVYFIQAQPDGLIKIGRAKRVIYRFREIAGLSPVPVKLIGIIEGEGHWLERALHLHFNKDRIRGEWFEPSAELLGLIARNPCDFDAASTPRKTFVPQGFPRSHEAKMLRKVELI